MVREAERLQEKESSRVQPNAELAALRSEIAAMVSQFPSLVEFVGSVNLASMAHVDERHPVSSAVDQMSTDASAATAAASSSLNSSGLGISATNMPSEKATGNCENALEQTQPKEGNNCNPQSNLPTTITTTTSSSQLPHALLMGFILLMSMRQLSSAPPTTQQRGLIFITVFAMWSSVFHIIILGGDFGDSHEAQGGLSVVLSLIASLQRWNRHIVYGSGVFALSDSASSLSSSELALGVSDRPSYEQPTLCTPVAAIMHPCLGVVLVTGVKVGELFFSSQEKSKRQTHAAQGSRESGSSDSRVMRLITGVFAMGVFCIKDVVMASAWAYVVYVVTSLFLTHMVTVAGKAHAIPFFFC